MLESSFLHLDGISEKTFQKIHALGISTWRELLERVSELQLKEKDSEKLKKSIEESQRALANSDISYFVKKFHPKDKWKILTHFYDEILYFDIETDHFQRVTLICCLYK
ncbi:MAG: hypothetical protein N3A69_06530, partial [Leptospiraceae bacterium]|nr:hypothetical protein [Leptospiraceae bacterium]